MTLAVNSSGESEFITVSHNIESVSWSMWDAWFYLFVYLFNCVYAHAFLYHRNSGVKINNDALFCGRGRENKKKDM